MAPLTYHDVKGNVARIMAVLKQKDFHHEGREEHEGLKNENSGGQQFGSFDGKGFRQSNLNLRDLRALRGEKRKLTDRHRATGPAPPSNPSILKKT